MSDDVMSGEFWRDDVPPASKVKIKPRKTPPQEAPPADKPEGMQPPKAPNPIR